MSWLGRGIVWLSTLLAAPVFAEDASPPGAPSASLWHYGGFVDLGYSLDFNFPQNHRFRDRSTTPRVNELDLNMGAVYSSEARPGSDNSGVRTSPTSRRSATA